MANPPLSTKGAAPAGWISAREIATTTGERMSAILNMLDNKNDEKREPTIWTRVTGQKWVDMPDGGRTLQDQYEEYEAFPGLYWSYRCQTVTDPVFDRYGGSDDHCLPESEGLDVIRRIRAYKKAADLYVPHLPDGFFDRITEPEKTAPTENIAEKTRDDLIVHAMRNYPLDGRRTKREGWPYIRDLRKRADIGDIKIEERKNLWPLV